MKSSYARLKPVSLLFFCFFTLLFFQQNTLAEVTRSQNATSLILTDKVAADLIKKNNLPLKEAENKLLIQKLVFEKIENTYRWNALLDYSKTTDKFDITSSASDYRNEADKLNLTLSKRFYTGTILSLEGLRQITNTELGTSATKNYQNYFNIGLEQSLFPNFFGQTERADYEKNFLENKRIELQNEFDLAEIYKTQMDLYWKLKASQVSITENESTLKFYQKLIEILKRKKANSYSTAGEYEQAYAEYLLTVQSLADEKAQFINLSNQFKTNLNIDSNTQLIIPKNNDPIEPVKFVQVNIENLKIYELQKLKSTSADLSAEASNHRNLPNISIYGKYGQQGLDPAASTSLSELTEGKKNKTVVGVKLSYTINDTAAELDRATQMKIAEIEKIKLSRSEVDLQSQLQWLESKIKNSFENIAVTENVVKMRSEALKQIEKNYSQGRSDISFVIDARNKKSKAEINLINAYADYAKLKVDYQLLTAVKN